MTTIATDKAENALEAARILLADAYADKVALRVALGKLAAAVAELPSPANLNVNVRKAHTGGECVEMSWDGAAFAPRVTFPNFMRGDITLRLLASYYAAAFAAGYQAAGGRVMNCTSHGERI